MTVSRQDLLAGAPFIATWQIIASGLVSEHIGRAGFDCVIVDLQHGEIGQDSLLTHLQLIELGGAAGWARVAWNDPAQIMRAVDFGAKGVIVPMVSTAADARRAVEATRYPPYGTRSFGPPRTLAFDREARPICLVMIETAEAIDNIDAIAAVPELDGVFIGASDLAISLGLQPSPTMQPELLAAIDGVVAACRRNGIIPGSVSYNPDNAGMLIERGMKFVAVGGDLLWVVSEGRRLAEEAAALRR